MEWGYNARNNCKHSLCQNTFFQLVDSAMHGEEIILTKAGKPAVKLVPYTVTKPQRKFGILKGKIRIAKDFDSPLPDDIFGALKETIKINDNIIHPLEDQWDAEE